MNNVIKRGDTYIQGSKLTANTSALNTSSFTTITIPATSGYVAIRIDRAVVDNYEAEGSAVVKKKGLTIVSLSKLTEGYSSNVDCDQDNNYTVGYNVVLRNSGNVALDYTDAGYSLTLLKSSDTNTPGDSMATFPIGRSLQPGDTLHMQVTKTFNYNENNYVGSYAVRENITNTQMTGASYNPVPYEVIPSVLTGSCTLTVYSSTDRHQWTKLMTIGKDGDADFSNVYLGYSTFSPAYKFKNFTIKGLATGNYYFAFEAGGAYLDNINGLKDVATDEDLYINNVKASKAEVNSPATFEATLQNLTARNYKAGELVLNLYTEKIASDSTLIANGVSTSMAKRRL